MKRTMGVLAAVGLTVVGWDLAVPADAGGQQADPVKKASKDGQFTVPAGFHVEQAVRPPASDKDFALVNCCFDDKGRLLVSKENGAILLCTAADKDGVLKYVKTYCDKVHHCQGMTWIRDSLWLVGEGPQGTGLYRCKDTKNADSIDDIKLVHAFKGGMSANGPHGVRQGPDGMIYVVLGNQGYAQIGEDIAKNGTNPKTLAKNSPLKRWPSGGFPSDPAKKKAPANEGEGEREILPAGGTIWRMDHDGKNMGLVASGFRNALDAAFAPNGELFTADGDLEANEGMPWYRPVRVCLCPPGADFVWHAGPVNTPDYVIDSLPPTVEVGRGTAGGMEFYDHVAYPQQYRGAYFMADPSAGVIYSVRLDRNGASYRSVVESFCKGAAMPVTDLCVGPDGAIYFVLGGNKGQGGAFRIVYAGADGKSAAPNAGGSEALADWPQPQAAWSQKKLAAAPVESVWEKFLNDSKIPAANRIRMTAAFQQLGNRPELGQIEPLLKDKDAELRAHAIWLIGVNGFDKAAPALFQAMSDSDALVRRRACEALIRIGAEPPMARLWPLLNEKDRFVRSAARLVLERIDPKKWVDKVWSQPKSYREINETHIWNSFAALCHAGHTPEYVEQMWGRLHGNQTHPSEGSINYPPNMLEWLRAIQLTMAHGDRRPFWSHYIVNQCEQLFPHEDARVNRELAILLTTFQRERQLEKPIQIRLLKVMAARKNDRMTQIHFAYCMSSLRDGWTPETAKAMTAWYEGTRDWTGGSNFRPVLEKIFKDCAANFPAADKKGVE